MVVSISINPDILKKSIWIFLRRQMIIRSEGLYDT